MPEDFRAEGLVEAFRAMGAGPGWKVLIPRAEDAREILPDTLRDMGCTVDVVVVYRTQRAQRRSRRSSSGCERAPSTCVTFTSGAIARGFVSAVDEAGLDAGQVMSRLLVASIGPVTSDAIRDLGYAVDIEAPESTMSSLVEAIGAYYSAGR